MVFTLKTHPAGSESTPRPPGLLRRWRFWAALAVGVALVAGWSVADYALSTSHDNATAVAELDKVNRELSDQLDSVTHERNVLQANKIGVEDAAKRREEAAKQREDAAARHEAAVKGREDTVKQREDAATQQEKVVAQNTITEGNWAVGIDVQPGTYRTKEAVTDHCYWAILSDANGRDIIANDIVAGGRPTVTLKGGQFFTSNRCGDWIKV
jgi:hypothetical protein